MLIISYQNFSNVSPTDWDKSQALNVIKEMNEFEKNNPEGPKTLATPQSGNDLESVSNDWLQRQGSLLLNGYDKKLEAKLNDKLNSWVENLTAKDQTEKDIINGAQEQSGVSQKDSKISQPNSKQKQNLRFSRVNSLNYDLGTNSCLNLTANPGNTHLNFSQILSSNTKLGLEHHTSNNKTQMIFKYEW
ncbi:MAG: hypothetical protein IPM97_14255 [Bdellovibrionaceae bacterium]|nr:hypothetical protein [Pseudobdellovibrionaceae bacterium]